MKGSWQRLVFYAGGVYGCFLAWGVLQERISTIDYKDETGSHRFVDFIALNLCMSIFASILALVGLQARGLGLGLKDKSILVEYLKIAISISIASPFGYESLKHISFPTIILGKSCKLFPVMLMNFIIYRKHFPWYKYVSVALITIGVAGFMFFDPKQMQKEDRSSSLFGIGLLLTNLLIDGVTNSWQDKIFLRYDINSLHMMFFMNLFSSIGSLLYIASPLSNELYHFISFASSHNGLMEDILKFSVTGSLGQIFIFSLLEEFGSLTLVTVTVTRKLFTILLSLFLFAHPMRNEQWLFVSIAFIGIIVEAVMKRSPASKVVEIFSSKSKED